MHAKVINKKIKNNQRYVCDGEVGGGGGGANEEYLEKKPTNSQPENHHDTLEMKTGHSIGLGGLNPHHPTLVLW